MKGFATFKKSVREKGGDPRLIILFILLLPLMVIWETAKKS